MCGRYTLNKKADDIAKRYNVSKVPKEMRPNYNTAPMQVMPVITEDENGKHQVELMHWGITRKLFLNGKVVEKDIINTRADKAFGGFWKKTVVNHRCLIPATSFFEWKDLKEGKTPFLIHPKKLDLYSFAGIWSTWKNKDGHDIKVYSIMTTEPNKEMKAIHTRMPVILHPEDEASWIEPSNDKPESLGKLLFPFEDNGLEIYEVSRDVNSTKNNYPELLLPVTA